MPHRLLVKDHVDLDPRLQSVYLDNQGTQSYKNSQYYTIRTWLFNIKDDGKSSLGTLDPDPITHVAPSVVRGLNHRASHRSNITIAHQTLLVSSCSTHVNGLQICDAAFPLMPNPYAYLAQAPIEKKADG